MTQKQRERLQHIRTVAPKCAGIFERVYNARRPGRRDLIKAKCLDCCGYSVKEAGMCSVETCSLWPANPYRLKLATCSDSDCEGVSG
jgi:hypothetical protein